MSLVHHKEQYMVYFTSKLWAEARVIAFHESNVEAPEEWIRLMYVCQSAMEEMMKPIPNIDWIAACGARFSEHMLNLRGNATAKDVVQFPFVQRVADPLKTLIGLN
jgi:hypothetical protein